MRDTIERMLSDDIRLKKKSLSGVRAKTGKRGYVGRMLTPVDCLSRKEKRLYKGTTKVRSFNMYDNLMNRIEFEALEPNQQKVALEHWRTKYSIDEMRKALQMSGQTVYNRMDDLGVDRPKRGKNKEPKQKKQTKQPNAINQTVNVVQTPVKAEERPQDADGFHVFYSGRYGVEEIQSKLEKLGLILDGETNKFEIQIRINEIK